MQDDALLQKQTETVRAWRDGLGTGDAAQLRRAYRPAEALLARAGLDLVQRLRWPRSRDEHAAALAVMLAHVKQDTARPLFRACGRERWTSESALLREGRFQSLIQLRRPDEVMPAIVAIIRICDGVASYADLTEIMRWWPHEYGDGTSRLLRRIAREYYAANAPEQAEEIADA